MGNGQIWRVDPTGQFWNCHAVAMGRSADRAQEELYQLALKRQRVEADIDADNDNNDNNNNVAMLFEELTSEEAMDLACECMESVLFPKKQGQVPPASFGIIRHPPIHWHGVIMHYTASLKDKTGTSAPKIKAVRGAFLPPGHDKMK
jgi:20S proteasome alpha/beta subunit